jgi:hypothetical protein
VVLIEPIHLDSLAIVVQSVLVSMTDLTLSALHIAGDTLSDPKRRCMGTLAENTKGFPTEPWDPTACRWDLSGALCKAMFELKIETSAEQLSVYQSMKEVIGLDPTVAAPIFWDCNESMHDLVAERLRKAE